MGKKKMMKAHTGAAEEINDSSSGNDNGNGNGDNDSGDGQI